MSDASKILFSTYFEGKVLFKNQQDLVINLLNEKGSPYYMDQTNPDFYNKAQTRLKTYVSQLLSQTATRNVTEDFKEGLTLLVRNKGLIAQDVHQIITDIIEDLNNKNSSIGKVDSKSTVWEDFISAFSASHYLVIITAKPLEVEANYDITTFSLRNVFFNDFFFGLENERDIKYYRFNFPLRSYANVFWMGVKKVLTGHIRNSKKRQTLLETLHNKFIIEPETYESLMATFNDQALYQLVDEILNKLNKQRLLMVFVSESPIYSSPIIATNPSGGRDFKLFTLLDNQTGFLNVHRFTETDSVLWRLFVWDKLKESKFTGESISFESVISSQRKPG